MPYKERSLANVLNDIDQKCKKFNVLKAVTDTAKILYRNIKDKNIIFRGINKK